MTETKARPKPQILKSALLARAGFRHAFFARGGGVSVGPYASLNFSFGVGDLPHRVAANLESAAAALGVERDRLLFLSQVHGNAALKVDAMTRDETLAMEGDALLSDRPDQACAVRTADCVPILAADQSTGRVAAIHAGWRGLVAGVIANALRQLGGEPRGWIAAVGPHISVEAFEISEDVAEELRICSPAPDVIRTRPGHKPHADLRKIADAQLKAAGMPESQIDHIPGCTVLDEQRFFSYRRDGARSGRHLAAIVPRNPKDIRI